MCGISGIINKSYKPIKEHLIEEMGSVIKHRGPDNFAIYKKDNFAFGHNRLSIIDISSLGNQPFYNDRYVLCYNGEIYNYLKLKKGLQKKQVEFKGASDTEVLFYYLIYFGVAQTLKDIEGMFAFSFYDIKKKELFLCRDRFGMKPLYFTNRSDYFAWGSEIKAILKVGRFNLHGFRSLFSVMGAGEQSGKYTLFEDIFSVRPGQYLKFSNGRLTKKYYFDISDYIDQNYYNDLYQGGYEYCLQNFDRLLNESVNKMLMSDVKIGSFLSGGIDSSLISSIASKYCSSMSYYCSNVIGEFSELGYAREVSDKLKGKLHIDDYRSYYFIDQLAEKTYFNESPIIKLPNSVPFSNIAKIASDMRVKPILSGEGSDELFLGYPTIAFNNYYKRIFLAPQNILKFFYDKTPLLNRIYSKSIHTNQSNNKFANMLLGYEREIFNSRRDIEGFSFLSKKDNSMQYESIKMFREHLIALLHRNDRMGMQRGIEARFPFLDEDIVKFGINLPHQFKIKKTWKFFNKKHPFFKDKAIVRDVAKKYLPNNICNKIKWGFGIDSFSKIIIKKDFFKNSWVIDKLELNDRGIDYIIDNQDDLIKKLVAVDTFGRIFDYGQTIEEVNNHNKNHLIMKDF